ncbi:stalk domain-containing protein [Paenibacillus sp. NFR01]|uniref:stalk domain-containing protein n=1 Tax=Paenibacillus sp. NFR01 TaxID=1566279 RepID=UPI0008BFE800|nr:stalk domain-containing protein [Paenibacillus sp. NFR01]SES95142.1 Copper amine oxidase N-terminal domain-containing protein [Paenibacillus sp. NFR01]
MIPQQAQHKPGPRPGNRRAKNRRIQARETVLRFLFLTGMLAVVMALLVLFIDPLQFYHRPGWYTPVFSKQERYQNPGLAKNFDYDTIIIGTSMTENFLPSEVTRALGGTKTMKLSIEGSTAEEHYKMAKLALETGKPKKVLWGLDYFSLKSSTEEEQETFPDYLYDGKLWNDYRYLFNASVYTQFFVGLGNTLSGGGSDLEHLNNWNGDSVFSKARTAKSYHDQSAGEAYFGINEEDTPLLQERFTTYIERLLTDYPDVEFYFYYPPYSIMRQVAWYNVNPKRYTNQLEMRKWMFERISRHPNAKLYDFQTEASWTFNLDLYKDISHHNQDVNRMIAERIGADDPKYRVTADNVDKLNETLIKQTTSALMSPDGNVYAYEVLVNGEPYSFTKKLVQSDGELFLPAAEVAKALGATINWDAAAKTAALQYGQTRLQMTAGLETAAVGDTNVNMAHPLVIVGGRAMIPLAFAAGQLGLPVSTADQGWYMQLSIEK